MTTQKYTILDENQQPTGFLILQQPQQLHASTSLTADGHADTTFLLACLVGFTLTLWTILSLWIAISVGMTCTIALAALKIWRNGNSQTQIDQSAPRPKSIKIHIESRTETGGFLLDSIEDDTISLADLKNVAEAIIVFQVNFSRPSLEKFISQGKYHKIKNEFVRMNFAHKKGNNYVLSPRAFSFLKKIRVAQHLPQ